MDIVYFNDGSEFRTWLHEHHHSVTELWLGFYKKSADRAGLAYSRALDEALCFGWIDGVRKRVDDQSYCIRFTPRKSGSIWSTANVTRFDELSRQGLVELAGIRAFEGRDWAKSESYSYERPNRSLDDSYEQQFRANQRAWDFFQEQPPSYRKAANWWVMSAKKEETRQKRLARLIEDSGNGRRLAHLTRKSGR